MSLPVYTMIQQYVFHTSVSIKAYDQDFLGFFWYISVYSYYV